MTKRAENAQRRRGEPQPRRVLRRRLAPDLGDLAVAVAGQPLQVPPEILVEQLDLLTSRGLAERGLVEDLALRGLRLVDLAGLGDGGLLGVGERASIDVGVLVLLPEALHRQFERALGGVVRHHSHSVTACRGCSPVPARRVGLITLTFDDDGDVEIEVSQEYET